MKKRKGILGVILTFSLFLGLRGIATAAEMSGMDMGGMDKSATQTQLFGESGSLSTEQHKATAGMDSNMQGMQSSEEQSNVNGSGVDWPVVDGFAIINLLVIGSAGVLKFKKKILPQN